MLGPSGSLPWAGGLAVSSLRMLTHGGKTCAEREKRRLCCAVMQWFESVFFSLTEMQQSSRFGSRWHVHPRPLSSSPPPGLPAAFFMSLAWNAVIHSTSTSFFSLLFAVEILIHMEGRRCCERTKKGRRRARGSARPQTGNCAVVHDQALVLPWRVNGWSATFLFADGAALSFCGGIRKRLLFCRAFYFSFSPPASLHQFLVWSSWFRCYNRDLKKLSLSLPPLFNIC